MSSALGFGFGLIALLLLPELPRAFWTPALNFLSEELNCLALFVSDRLSWPPPDPLELPLANVVGANLLGVCEGTERGCRCH